MKNISQNKCEVAKKYYAQGFMPIPIPHGSKKPNFKDWQNFKITEDEIHHYFNEHQQNIGVLLGKPSNGLVDVDLDCPEAIQIAPILLPQTEAIFGRTNKHCSHYLFIADNAKTEKFVDPLRVKSKDTGERKSATLVEIRSTGGQTIFPASTHPSGELITWDVDGEPLKLNVVDLRKAVARLAAASLLARYWRKGIRNDASLCLAGGLLRAGRTETETKRFIESVCIAAQDEEIQSRFATVEATAKKLKANEKTKGWRSLTELFDERVVRCVRAWLEISDTQTETIEQATSDDEENTPIISRWGEFMSADFTDSKQIAFHLQRGELGLLVAVTNKGKSTLIRNVLLYLACGGEFLPLVERGTPRKVLLMDFETTPARLQHDLQRMVKDFTSGELKLIAENFVIVCAQNTLVKNEPLSLSHHLKNIKSEAIAHKPDVIVIDTMSAAFDLNDENDNAGVTRFALKPLHSLARSLNAVLLTSHHIGKSGSENANQGISAYRGRGASAFGCYVTSAFSLTADSSDKTLVTLECGKRKDGEEEYSIMLRLDPATRWFSQVNIQQTKTNYDIVIDAAKAYKREFKTAEIIAAVKDKVTERRGKECLAQGVIKGDLISTRHGYYQSAVCASPISPAQTALSKSEAAND